MRLFWLILLKKLRALCSLRIVEAFLEMPILFTFYINATFLINFTKKIASSMLFANCGSIPGDANFIYFLY